MLSFNRKVRAGSLSLVACLGLGLALSACQVRPLYSTAPTITDQSLSAELASVQIEPANNRVEQEIRNHLIFAFTGGGEAATPAYRLDIALKNTNNSFDIENGTGLAKTTRVSLTATYKLIKIADGTIATTGSSFFTASFARSTQRFANDRALRDAENRAAQQVANDIQLRLSTYFVSGN
ncbi:LPS-assembly lipoprotein [Cohaesibacter sp. ES.047]|uniref:LPS assembly lipoprotein LptE n=1 Tax=Cohaesibacter sp. ES.047 TaxID=1798205 RepID=UPI000BB8D7AD|nr:LPS assembly lipoprotein LptE [Cohaesibacter sp. ES.047]SNY90529.1 LPS-assembly lipoprotein [Cohaesibacter sp. ES.047]